MLDYIPSIITEDINLSSAVLIPIVEIDGDEHIVFEVRSSSLGDQPGDVCLPGGAIEEGETPSSAAIRECCEELLVERDQVELKYPTPVLSRLGLTIYPFLAYIRDYDLQFNKDEVSSVFTVPLKYFKGNEPKRFKTEWKVTIGDDFPSELVAGGKGYKWRKHIEEQLFYRYEDHVIWGYTAKIIYAWITKGKTI